MLTTLSTSKSIIFMYMYMYMYTNEQTLYLRFCLMEKVTNNIVAMRAEVTNKNSIGRTTARVIVRALLSPPPRGGKNKNKLIVRTKWG